MILSQGDDPMIFSLRNYSLTTQYSIGLALPLKIRFKHLERQWNVSLPVCSLQFVMWHCVGYPNLMPQGDGERSFKRTKKACYILSTRSIMKLCYSV